ncbi:MAG: hypothetical protein HPY78_03945 [Brevinematales bacterium]|nr:hypothetical protein [Brevinematales bacterium]
MKLVLSSQEWDILSTWADKVLVGGRWGDGRMTVGEEERVLEMVRQRPKSWEISSLELRVLRYWIENLSVLSPLEKQLAEKISALSEK